MATNNDETKLQDYRESRNKLLAKHATPIEGEALPPKPKRRREKKQSKS